MAFLLGKNIFMVGIKGTGMSTLALYLQKKGSTISGWDVEEVFTSDAFLLSHSIPFSSLHPSSTEITSYDFIIYSSAYKENHPILQEAAKKSIPLYSYFEFLGVLSTHYPTYGVSGTHGKTTSVATVTHILNQQKHPFSSIYGSTLIDEDLNIVDSQDDILILEACEYQDHFLSLSLRGLFITNIELEHSDYFKTYSQIFESFLRLIEKLPMNAPLILNKDEKGIEELIKWVHQQRKDLTLITYGKSLDNDITYLYPYKDDIHTFFINQLEKKYSHTLVGSSFVSDMIGASLLATVALYPQQTPLVHVDEQFSYLKSFNGAKGRVELMSRPSHFFSLYNDYAHHPSEIVSSLETLRFLHPNSRLILLFFPHTMSRMTTFFQGFVDALSSVDYLFVFPVAMSARQDGNTEEAKRLSEILASESKGTFVENNEVALKSIQAILHTCDVCITMGAGNTHSIIEPLLGLKEPIV